MEVSELFRLSSIALAAQSKGFFDILTDISNKIQELLVRINNFNLSETIGIPHFTDYIDLALLALLIFCALRYVRKRRSGKMIAGIVILFVIYLVCDLLSFHTVAFVLQTFYHAGAVALIILFSKEIKSGLESLGSMPQYLFRLRYHKGGKDVYVERIMDAVTSISLSEKMGAIIVIEGYTKLDDHIEKRKGHNTLINAEISSELLKTIFMNGTELHDGGLIIRKGRVYAASCYFPPTENFEYVNRINSITGHPLGSRHQAAIGLSEKCDAVVIVISEETHAMSVAYRGEIFMDLTTDQLEDVVTAAMMRSGSEVKKTIDNIKKVKVH